MNPADARSGLLSAIQRAELHDDPLAPVLAALGDALVSIDSLVTRAESASTIEAGAVARIEQAVVAGTVGAAHSAVGEIQSAIALLIKQVTETKRPHLTEQDRAEFVQITSAASGLVVAQRDRSRARFLAGVFGVLALVAAAGAGVAGYSIRSDRCGLLEGWAASAIGNARR